MRNFEKLVNIFGLWNAKQDEKKQLTNHAYIDTDTETFEFT